MGLIIASLLGVLISADSASAHSSFASTHRSVATTIVLAGVGGSKGGILLDPSLDVANVEADLTIVTTGVATSSDWQDGRRACSQSSPSLLVTSEGTSTPWPSVSLSMDWADPRIRLSVGRRGAPARTAAHLATVTQEPVIGAAVVVMPPLGSPRPVRRAADRQPGVWPFNPDVGATRALGSWTLDGAAGV
jgi:hypothetical protein